MQMQSNLYEKLNHINKCDICVCQYDRHDKMPVIICSMHHTICRECLYDLKATKLCPYCREHINVDKVVVNNYILQLLPDDPPNIKADQIQIPEIRPILPPQNPQPPIQFIPDEHLIHYIPLYDRQNQPLYGQNRDNINFFQRMLEKIQFNNEKRRNFYFVIFIIQLPFLFLNFYFAFTGKDEKCFDTSYDNHVLRLWLMGMGKTGALIMVIVFVGVCLTLCQAIQIRCLQFLEFIAGIILGIKIILWLYMWLDIYRSVISPHCSGGMYIYGFIQTGIHYMLWVLAIIVCGSK